MATTTRSEATTAAAAARRSTNLTSDETAHAVTDFVLVRPRLLGIAQRILGSRAEAEDVVQDAWLRWQGCDRSTVDTPTAFLVTATTRLAINAAGSARVRRTADVGDRVPEHVDPAQDPSLGAERREALEIAVRVLFERLVPIERAAYVLRHAFDYPHRQIARLLGITEANARQILVRAGRHLGGDRAQTMQPASQRRVLAAFLLASERGEVRTLEGVLAGDIVRSDGRRPRDGCLRSFLPRHDQRSQLAAGSSPVPAPSDMDSSKLLLPRPRPAAPSGENDEGPRWLRSPSDRTTCKY